MADELTNEDAKIRASIIRRARVEGVVAAYESALKICRDPKAPAQAVSNASRTLLQIGGLLDREDRQEAAERDPAEMDGYELQRAANAAARRILERYGDAEGDVFE